MESQGYDQILESVRPILSPPPEACYLKLQATDLKVGEGMSGIRRIFDGNVQYDAFEIKILADFKDFAAKSKKDLDSYWTNSAILRFLQGNGYKFDKTLTAITDHSEWRKVALPPKITPPLMKFLSDGVFYIQGRDNMARPIITFVPIRMDMKNLDVEVLISTITFLFNTIITLCMVPGKIENWIFIIDLYDLGLTSLPLMAMKRMMSFLSSTFRSRLFTLYVVNTPRSIFIPWNFIKPLLEEQTLKKINFFKTQVPDQLLTIASKEQVEVKYGGIYPDRKAPFWPPQLAPLKLSPAQIDHQEMEKSKTPVHEDQTDPEIFHTPDSCPKNSFDFTPNQLNEGLDIGNKVGQLNSKEPQSGFGVMGSSPKLHEPLHPVHSERSLHHPPPQPPVHSESKSPRDPKEIDQ